MYNKTYDLTITAFSFTHTPITFDSFSHHLSPSLTISHHLSPSLTISHHLSPSLTISHHLSPSLTITFAHRMTERPTTNQKRPTPKRWGQLTSSTTTLVCSFSTPRRAGGSAIRRSRPSVRV